jgi:hypothetical protein
VRGCTSSGVRLWARVRRRPRRRRAGRVPDCDGDVDVEHAMPKRDEGEQERVQTRMRGLVRPRVLPRVGRRRETGWPVRRGEADPHDSCGARAACIRANVYCRSLQRLCPDPSIDVFFSFLLRIFIRLSTPTDTPPPRPPSSAFLSPPLPLWVGSDRRRAIHPEVRPVLLYSFIHAERESGGRGVCISERVPLLVCRDACGLIGR